MLHIHLHLLALNLNLRNSNLVLVDSLTFSNAWSPYFGKCISNTNVFLSGNPTSVASVLSGTCFTVSN